MSFLSGVDKDIIYGKIASVSELQEYVKESVYGKERSFRKQAQTLNWQNDQAYKCGKALSWWTRHGFKESEYNSIKEHIPSGWSKIEDLLKTQHLHNSRKEWNPADVVDAVVQDTLFSKQRFQIKGTLDGNHPTYIRAVQGHSCDVNPKSLGWEEVTYEELAHMNLWHATSTEALPSILEIGVIPGGPYGRRSHIHMTDAKPGSKYAVAGQKFYNDTAVLLDGVGMKKAGIMIWRSPNRVILSHESIPPFFIRKAIHIPTDATLYVRPAFNDPKAKIFKALYDALEVAIQHFHQQGQPSIVMTCEGCQQRVVYGTIACLKCGGSPTKERTFGDMAQAEKNKLCGTILSEKGLDIIASKPRAPRSGKETRVGGNTRHEGSNERHWDRARIRSCVKWANEQSDPDMMEGILLYKRIIFDEEWRTNMMRRINNEGLTVPQVAAYAANRLRSGLTPVEVYKELESNFDDLVPWPGPNEKMDEQNEWETKTNAFDDTASNVSFFSTTSRRDVPEKYQRTVTSEEKPKPTQSKRTFSKKEYYSIPEEIPKKEWVVRKPWEKRERNPPWKESSASSKEERGATENTSSNPSSSWRSTGWDDRNWVPQYRGQYHPQDVRDRAKALMIQMDYSLGNHWKDYVHLVYAERK
jgi:RNA:NAD 2'-phosphotransferase (TPT1/KptA family)